MKSVTWVLAAFIAIAGCTSPTEAPQEVAQIFVSPNAMTLDRGATHALVVSLLRSDGTPLPKLPLVYASDFPKVVSVSKDGVVRAVGKGQATISVSREGARANVAITVTDTGAAIPVYLSIGSVALDLWAGDTVQATATVRNKWGEPIEDARVTWTSAAPEVVTISEAGLVKAHAPGTATVTIAAEQLRRTMAVLVKDTATTVEGTDRMIPGADAQLRLWALDQAAHTMQTYAAQWASSDPTVITIDANGVATALRHGTSMISGTAGARSAKRLVTVERLAGTVAYRASGNFVTFLALDGSAPEMRVIDSRAIGLIAFSPDGNNLAYECGSGVCLRNMADKLVTVLRPSASDPSWTADGKTIGIQNGGDGFLMLSPTGDVRQTLRVDAYAYHPRIAADGSGFSFECNLYEYDPYAERTDVCFTSVGQAGARLFLSGASNLAWSPANGIMAFVDHFGGYSDDRQPRLCISPVGSPHCVFNPRRECWTGAAEPAWSPDGALLVFVKSGTLWIGDATGNVCMRLPRAITDGSIVTSPTWGSGTMPPP